MNNSDVERKISDIKISLKNYCRQANIHLDIKNDIPSNKHVSIIIKDADKESFKIINKNAFINLTEYELIKIIDKLTYKSTDHPGPGKMR